VFEEGRKIREVEWKRAQSQGGKLDQPAHEPARHRPSFGLYRWRP
jgi:hypothetical protein